MERKITEYGCIGEHLGHSFSAEIHAMLGKYDYRLCELKPEEVGDFMRARDFRGINVTIPYKRTVIPYLDSIDGSARAIGAVNTVLCRDGKAHRLQHGFLRDAPAAPPRRDRRARAVRGGAGHRGHVLDRLRRPAGGGGGIGHPRLAQTCRGGYRRV
ncbi:MAG: hypothetical protein L6V84_05510 [Oscillospiraceae bacterium]|nr:MAG: hypothetical protein L6V84_05510 [Oscillospiraceae bacterium]